MGDVRSRRGVYYDLNQSPYEYNSPYGDCFKFPSEKKLEIYTRDIEKEIAKTEKILNRYNLLDTLPVEIVSLIKREVYKGFYSIVVR